MADNKTLSVEIVTPQKAVFKGEALSATAPGELSPFQILYNHAPIVSSLETGKVKLVDTQNKTIYFAVGAGFAEVLKNKISILVETAVNAEEIDLEEAARSAGAIREKLKETTDPRERQSLGDKLLYYDNLIKTAETAKQA